MGKVIRPWHLSEPTLEQVLHVFRDWSVLLNTHEPGSNEQYRLLCMEAP